MIKYNNIFKVGLAILIIVIGIDLLIGISPYWYTVPIGFVLLGLALGSFIIGYDFFIKAITKLSTAKYNTIALTFDDGPNKEYTQKVLEVLDKHNVKATFFCIGKHVEKHPQLLRSILEKGHSIGNHSYSHHKLIDFSSTKKWIREIEKTDEIIKKHTGQKPLIFRPPFGVTTPNLAKALEITGHKVIGWNIRSFDTVTKNPHEVLSRIYKKIKPGSIILLHDSHNRIPFILEHLLLYLKEKNYLVISLDNIDNDV